ncbi:putative capsid protein [Porcine serum associated circular DNA virus 2]|uniref:putative capsid protein n=1 Tax=Porcine serum associated circular DNA virus 2 TaxID=2517212 RepID=UPI000EB72320|nr:putative capsid protein [Porcine serum associated circular DNA virus 2]AXV43457.1 putative capsid protein [Porcine serum associated circular DNA virus 2]
MVFYGARKNRRYNRRRNSRLSTRRIYSRTSAKSQASQIAALRNRINKVYKVCKPEIKTIVTSAETMPYTSQTGSSYYRFYPMTSPDLGTGDKDRIGNFIRVINGVLYLSCEYYNSSATGYHNTESSGAQVRVVIGQYKQHIGAGTVPNIDELFEFPSNTGANYTQMALSPLLEGITNKYNILKDLRFTLTTDRNQKMLKIPFKPIAPYVFNDEGLFPNCWACLVVTGLHYDTDFTETVKITVSDKLVFTDA